MNYQIKKINFIHSFIFFLFCNIFSLITFVKINFAISPLICFLLILSIGVSHGSLDNMKGKKLFEIFKINNFFIFYLSYISLAILIIIFWIILPSVSLAVFLIVASYHFGKEDTDFIFYKNNLKNDLLYFFKGSLVITAPLIFHKNQTIEIFKSLNFNISDFFIIESEFLYLLLIASFLSSIYLTFKKELDLKSILIMDWFSILILNFFLNPILAFTIYFCFLHSIRHSLSLILDLDNNIFRGLKSFIKKAIPLTLITAIMYLISLYYINNYYELDEAVYKVIFIGLASLTFPHILLEYLIEKYER